jgi:HEAT repeat protein
LITDTDGSADVQPSGTGRRRRCKRFPAIPLILCLVAVHCGTPPEERRLSIYKLKSEPTPENIDRIRASLDDPDRDVRATALHALVGLAVPDSGALALDALGDADGFVRATAAKLVGDLGDPDHVEAVRAVLSRDPDPVARQRAAESLTRLGGAGAVAALAHGLSDPMERVRLTAVRGLAKLDPASAREELARLLHEDAVWEIRAEAAHALGLTGDPDVLSDLEAASADPNEFVRSAVSNALRLHEKVRLARPASNPEPTGVY